MNKLMAYMGLLVVAFVILAGCDDTSKTRSEKSVVKLTLMTEPKGADVYLDGKKLTETTPLETILKDHFEHMVELRAEGYESKWLKIPDTHGIEKVDHDFGEIKLREVKVPVIIRSTPPGAFVSLAGEDLGKTPIYLKGVSPGKYDAVFRFTGHANMTKKIIVDDDDLNIIRVSLSSITGSLTVVTNPPQSDVFLDGDRKGVSDADGRLVINDVDEGRHSIKVVKAGFYDLKHKVTVKANENTVASVPELRMLPGDIKVVSEPAGAKVYRDGLFMGETPTVLKSLVVKEYTVKVELSGYDVGRKVVKVIPGMTKQVNFALESIYGSATLVTKPSECAVVVDGVKRGTTEVSDAPGISKPLVLTELKPGIRLITIEKAGYKSETKKVLVTRGKETRIPPVSLDELWLPTHWVRERNEMKARLVKVLSDDGRNVEIEYKKGQEIITYQVKKSNILSMKAVK